MKTRTHIYWRVRGGARRAYADLREYADVEGGREALAARGEKRATTDPATAQVLLARRLEQLDGLRRGRALHGLAGQATLADFAGTHLVAKGNTGKVTDAWLVMSETTSTGRSSTSVPPATSRALRRRTCASGARCYKRLA